MSAQPTNPAVIGSNATTMQPRNLGGEIVDNTVLTNNQWSTLLLAAAFAGTTNPTTIWQTMVRDDQRAYSYYRELELKDADVGGAIEEMKLSVLRRERALTAFDDSTSALEIRDFVQAELDRVDMDRVCDNLLDAPFHGLSVAEIIYDIAPGRVGIRDIRDCPQELFAFGLANEPQVGPLQFLKDGIALLSAGEQVPEEKFLIFSYRPRGRNRRGQPLLRNVFWSSWFKRNVQRFWLRLAEKGPGTAAVKYANNAAADEKAKALAVAEAMISSTAIAVPENVGLIVELLTQARPQNPDVYDKLFTKLAMEIQRRIKGETLTSFGSEGSHGSRSMGETHSETKEQRSISFATMLERVIQDQLVRRLVLYNFGPNALALAPQWTIEKNPPENLKSLVEIHNALQQMGMDLPKSFMQEMYGVPEAGAGDEVLVRTPTAPPTVGRAGGPDVPFSEDDTRVRAEARDVDALLKQLQDEGAGIFEQRLMELVPAGGAR